MDQINSTLQEIQECMDKSISLENPLTKHYQYLKFIEAYLISHVGEESFSKYLKRFALKSLETGLIESLRKLNPATLCRVAFNPSANVKRYMLNPYPHLSKILSEVIDDIKNEQKCNGETILMMCKEKINNRESLHFPLELYKENVDWKYLSFAESIVVPDVGEYEFCLYVKEFLSNGLKKGNIKNYTPSEAFRWILEGGKPNKNVTITKYKDRYPKLFKAVEQALEEIINMGTQGVRNVVKAHLQNKINDFNKMSPADFMKHCRKVIQEEFHEQRRKINKVEFSRVLFQEESLTKNCNSRIISPYLRHVKDLNELLETEIIEQIKYLRSWNEQSMKLEKDEWIIYFNRGLSLHSIKINFALVQAPKLRDELKMYFLYSYNADNSYATYKDFSNIIRGLKILQEKFDVGKIADFNRFHVAYLFQYLEYEAEYSVLSIKKTVGALSKFAEYILDKKNYGFKPKENVFKTISIHNVEAMSKNTEFMPDEVINQLQLHVDELDSIYRLMYEIFSYTGLRPKEVIELEIDCFQISKEYAGYVKMNYIPHKILKARRMRGLSDYNFVYIPMDLYEKIQERIIENQDIYVKHNLKYLFARRTNHGVFIPKTRDFCLAINRLIKAHNICDLEGKLWHFTAKQVRKTVAVNLIENDATPQEVANQLGHLSQSTTEKYYIEVKKAKLAELNTEFFKKKFELNVGKENLDLYSEEERRQLYVDFCLNKREVEFGTCTKHHSEGPCGSRVGASSCAVCPKLCTGKKYLYKWNELKESQTQIIDELHRIYEENGIDDYQDFIEYKKETTLLKRYSTVVQEIINFG
ncbi:tyrosine-type recombinase/integrase [Bacillus badius]|uniref:tyrosine-type recombinase/integrase n=1 Tax=Bacillus badius TaxID=1455 RepID=UPI002E1BC3F0|nr:tyrosine-type recombinase/integrase [Bacillus badius]MED0666067.1 tyrosine-type recombinase/integrase [Bacillus badius]